ncbi:MAG: hypothetical protein MPW15_20730 [Candidatus Manganitrophus sp.]|nr:hypothetical protein [Candidatus Manganitrophus sp.]
MCQYIAEHTEFAGETHRPSESRWDGVFLALAEGRIEVELLQDGLLILDRIKHGHIAGNPPSACPHATIVFQTFALFPWMTVQENVEVALARHPA